MRPGTAPSLQAPLSPLLSFTTLAIADATLSEIPKSRGREISCAFMKKHQPSHGEDSGSPGRGWGQSGG